LSRNLSVLPSGHVTNLRVLDVASRLPVDAASFSADVAMRGG
jgi:hypothetical protein